MAPPVAVWAAPTLATEQAQARSKVHPKVRHDLPIRLLDDLLNVSAPKP